MPNTISQRLKTEHKIVLRALEVANTAYNRVVDIDEVVTALSLSKKDVRLLKKAYDRELSRTVTKIIDQLRTRKFVFSPGMIGRRRYYGTESALAPEERSLPARMTRRQRVLKLVRATVEQLGRAVRVGDILDYAESNPETEGLTNEEITHDILSLKETGELGVIGSPLRKDDKGINLYLPSDLSPEDFTPSQPLTWLDEVAQAFNELWEERKKQAAAANRLPRPVTTGEVRAKLLASPQPHKNMQKSQPVVSAMIALSETSAAVVRKVKRKGQRASLWAPRDLPDEQLDIGDAYATDSERVGEAVRRAVERLGRPVNLRDIKIEIKFDLALQPAGNSNLFEILTDTSKRRIDKTGGALHERVNRRFFRVGRVDGESYYYHLRDGLPDARFYVRFHQIKSRWLASCAEDQFDELEEGSFPSIAVGRALLISADTESTLTALTKLLESQQGDKETRAEAEEVLSSARNMNKRVREWLNSSSLERLECPKEVSTNVPTWTAGELLSVLKPLYPHAQKITDPNSLIRLLFGVVRRVPNPHFIYRFSKDPDAAAEFLFDRTDALLYAAKKWGGRECCLQAMMAGSQLGRLRDAKFIVPVLKRKAFEDQLIGVACLAFLQTPEAKKLLRNVAVRDKNPSVRQAALWACGFSSIEGLQGLISNRVKDETDVRVRDFAASALNADSTAWWFM